MTKTLQEERLQTSAVLLEELSNPEVLQALVTLIHKLPELNNAVLKMEQGIDMVTKIVVDPDVMDQFTEPVNQFAKIALKQDNLQALGAIMEKMPRIAKTVELLDQISPFVEFISKRETLASFAEVLELISDPVTYRIQEGMSLVKEAQHRAEQDSSTISVFGVLKLLKDPAVQNGLKFIHAFLEIWQERKMVK